MKKINKLDDQNHKNLSEGISNFIQVQNALGYKAKHKASTLKSFLAYLKKENAYSINDQSARRWAQQSNSGSPNQEEKKLQVIREFCHYWKEFAPGTEVPRMNLVSAKAERSEPYIYDDSEIVSLLDHIKYLSFKAGSRKKIRKLNYYVIFGLIAATGMRHEEVLALNTCDVDMDTGVITVHKSKFGKSRRIPVHETTLDALRDFKKIRDDLFKSTDLDCFFISDQHTRVSKWSTRSGFVEISILKGLRQPGDSFGPRLHDMRHTFAVRSLASQYSKKNNVESMVPYLSTYLGHSKPSCTYWYLSAIPELIGLAAERASDSSTSRAETDYSIMRLKSKTKF